MTYNVKKVEPPLGMGLDVSERIGGVKQMYHQRVESIMVQLGSVAWTVVV